MNPPPEIAENQPLGGESAAPLSEYLDLCRRRVWLIVTLALATAGLAATWSFLQIPIYQARAGIVIEKRAPHVLQTEGQSDRGKVRIEEIETHVKLMKSYPLLKETGDRINLLAQPEYQEKKSRLGDLLKGAQISWIRDIVIWLRTVKDQLKEWVGGSPPKAILPGKGEAGAEFPDEAERTLIERFSAHVKVAHSVGSNLVLVTVKSENPEFAARAANTLSVTYIERNLERKSRTTESAAEWFATHLDDLRTRVEESEQALFAYRAEHGLVNVSNQQSIAAQKLGEQNSELVNAEMKRTEVQTRFQQIQGIQERIHSPSNQPSQDWADLASLTDVLNSEVIRNLRTREIELSVVSANLSEKYGPLHPKMIRAQTELRELKAFITDEVDKIHRGVRSEYQLALAREKAVREKLLKQKREKMRLDQHAGKYSLLEREANSNREVYDLYLKQMRRTDLSREIKTTNMYLAEPAIPNLIPVSPNTRLNTLLGLLIGLVSGVGLVFFLEYGGQTFKGPHDLERYLAGLVFLGWVPRLSEKRRGSLARIMELEPFSPAADSYRHIRTHVWLAGRGQHPFSIAISSPGEQEGKTTTAVNLAIALSQLEDNRVVLIDADLRQSGLARIFDIEEGKGKAKGLVHYLLGEVEAREILYPTQNPNLVVIPAGGIPPNPTDLLHSKQMAALLTWCKEQGLCTIVDTPAILPVVDGTVVASLVSLGSILVVSAGETKREAVGKAIEKVTDHGVRIVGVVMQKVIPNVVPSYYRAHRYITARVPQEYLVKSWEKDRKERLNQPSGSTRILRSS